MDNNTSPPSTPLIKPARRLSLFWLLPLFALTFVGWLLFQSMQNMGKTITLYFQDAAGLVAGRTVIRYQGVEIGKVNTVQLADGQHKVKISADIYPDAVKLLREQTVFWMVKPQASLTGVSGLDTLVSGNYIALQPGDGKFSDVFVTVNAPPKNLPVGDGLKVQLTSPDLGSINIGSSIFYKKIPVGKIYNYALDTQENNVVLKALISPEYAHLVTKKSRFWNISGIQANVGFSGVDIHMGNLATLVAGGIAFDSPDNGQILTDTETFNLYPNVKTAGRGIAIKVQLPIDSGIQSHGAPIMYQGLKIGEVTKVSFSESQQALIADAAIEPSMADLLTSGTRVLLEKPDLSLSGLKNIRNLISGNFLSIIPRDGTATRQFKAVTQAQLEMETPGSLSFKLIANNSFGIQTGTNITYLGLKVGRITHVKLKGSQVIFDALIYPTYAHLIKSNNRFYIAGGIEATVSAQGINVAIPAADQLISSAITFSSSGKSKVNSQYMLYKNESLAELALHNVKGFSTYQLAAKQLPGVSLGSPILYRNMTVGEVTDHQLTKSGVNINIKIANRYRHLITPQTVFWNHSGIAIKAGLQGVEIQAAPITTLIKGGISFDTLKGVQNKQGKAFKLYSSKQIAEQSGPIITFQHPNINDLKVNTEIRYQGLQVGRITSIIPNFNTKTATITAQLLPSYAEALRKKDNYYWLVSPSVSLTKVENIDSLLTRYIDVQVGESQQITSTFILHSKKQTEIGLPIVLESENRGSITVGTPLLYRDIQVGEVTNIELGKLADRVLISAHINEKYRQLVRKNTIFWNTSGVDVSIGLTGAEIRSGTIDNLLRGGIAFATPEKQPLLGTAKMNSHFLLYNRAEDEWKQWRTAIPLTSQ